VLNCDVDEFVLSARGESIFEATERSESGCTMFGGRWISNARITARGDLNSLSGLRHAHFRYLERNEINVCPIKWCVVPRNCRLEEQWGTHTVWGKDLASSYSGAFSYRHFRSISTNWKYQRCQSAVPDPKLHQFDEALDGALARSGMTRLSVRSRGLLSEIVREITRSRKSKNVAPKPLAVDPKDPALGGNMIGGDPNTYHPELWSFLVKRFSVKSILDVGCGEGHCVKYCSGLGVRAFGFDGLLTNVERAVVPIALHDLRLGPFIMPVDLVLCCEVVEHIEEKYLPNLLRTLANGRVIAMTHALPGQTGYHHVNCRPSGYWLDKLETLGYRFLPQETAEGKSRIKASGRWTYFIQSGLILERR
jgi:2-polyprenyl-3-methyl-5-hydroxy-6-metoxy-1,4-benzoquinol methylase